MFEPDPIWMGFTCGRCFEDFVAAYPPFVLRPEMPTAIRQHLDDLYALLQHSYYRYRFLDIAYTRSMQIVEMALRIRYQDFGSPEIQRRRGRKQVRTTPELGILLDWAESEGLIEETDDRPSWRRFDKRRIDVLRELRNYAVHADPETLRGVSIIGSLYRTVDFVNELYEDVDLRKRRHELERNIQRSLTAITANGAILTVDGIRWIIFHAEILYVKSSVNGWHYHLGCLKIFPPAPDDQGDHDVSKPILLCCSECIVLDQAVHFTAANGGKVIVEPIGDPPNEDKFREFSSGFAKYPVLWPAVIQPLADQRTFLKRFRLTDAEPARGH